MDVADGWHLARDFEAWRGGSRRAGERLFAALRERLAPYVARLGRELGPVDEEDLLQDGLMRFLEGARRFDASGGDAAILGWFRTTLRRRWWVLAHRSAREPARGTIRDEGADAVPAPAAGDGATTTHAGERRAEIRDRLGHLRALARSPGRLRLSDANRDGARRLVDRIDAVLLGGAQPAATRSEIAASLGWSPFKLWKVRGALGAAAEGAEQLPASPTRAARRDLAPPRPSATGRRPRTRPATPARRRACASTARPPAGAEPRRPISPRRTTAGRSRRPASAVRVPTTVPRRRARTARPEPNAPGARAGRRRGAAERRPPRRDEGTAARPPPDERLARVGSTERARPSASFVPRRHAES